MGFSSGVALFDHELFLSQVSSWEGGGGGWGRNKLLVFDEMGILLQGGNSDFITRVR